MDARKIQITENDLKNLSEAIREAENSGYRGSIYLQQLKGELGRAEIVAPEEIPADVITMNSKVILTDLTDHSTMELILSYPKKADAGEGRVSILAPIGTACLATGWGM